ncbi:hypothetical protein MNV49_007403 [Pseudohyphozyma bogoriensis]|nr:hypothetical protein MNV49_007403 [Pseudohyphozyma bogoriensis]
MASTFAPVPCIILLALSSPEILVLSITLTHGNCHLSSALVNLQKMFFALENHLAQHPEDRHKWPGVDMELRARLGVGKIVVALGSEGPVAGTPVVAKYFHGTDGLSNTEIRHPELSPPPETIVPSYDHPYYTISSDPVTVALPQLMALHEPSTIAYLALGPLTSLAHLHNLSPENSILHHFAIILCMGGAVDVPGNTTPVSEFNVYADPYAAHTLFSLSLPHLHILPLDLTTPHTLPFSLYTSLVDPTFLNTSSPSQPSGKPPITHFTSSFLEGTRETINKFGGDAMEQHDPVVVWALIDWSKGGPGSPFLESSPNSPNTRHVSAEMRKRIETEGFSRRVVERRRSSDLRARFMGVNANTTAQGPENALTEVPGEGEEEEVLEADEDMPGVIAVGGEGAEGEGGDGWFDDERLAQGWEWEWREFEVETSGTLTRGMLVSDRRRSAAVLRNTGQSLNRSIAVDQLPVDSSAEGGIGVGEDEQGERVRGTKVIVATPGTDTLRTLLLERIWGVNVAVWSG